MLNADEFRQLIAAAVTGLGLPADSIVVSDVRLDREGRVLYARLSEMTQRPPPLAVLVSVRLEGKGEDAIVAELRDELRKKLKFCPLCDQRADVIERYSDEKGDYDAYRVECPHCGATYIISGIVLQGLRNAHDRASYENVSRDVLAKVSDLQVYLKKRKGTAWVDTG